MWRFPPLHHYARGERRCCPALQRRAGARDRGRQRETEGGRTQCLEPVFPSKYPLFAALQVMNTKQKVPRERDKHRADRLLLQSTDNIAQTSDVIKSHIMSRSFSSRVGHNTRQSWSDTTCLYSDLYNIWVTIIIRFNFYISAL